MKGNNFNVEKIIKEVEERESIIGENSKVIDITKIITNKNTLEAIAENNKYIKGM